MRTHREARARALLGVIALAVAGVACADKAEPPVNGALNPHMKLLVQTVASEVAPTARYVMVAAAALIPGGDTSLIAMSTVPVSGASQTVTLNTDISQCLAMTAAKGKSGCSIIVVAALRGDSATPTDTNTSPFTRAFDFVLVGPFEVGSGRAPTISPIDLSASRFAVYDWSQDEALRLGAAQHVVYTGSASTGRALTGTYSGTADPVLYTITQGVDYAAWDPAKGTPPQIYPALAIFENGKWRRVLATSAPAFTIPASTPQGFYDVTALASNDVYVGGSSGLYKFDGSAFTKISAVTDTVVSLSSAPLAGGGRVVIVGAPAGKVWIGYGTTWTPYTTGSSSRFDGVCIGASNEAYAINWNSGALYRFNGTTWTSVPTGVSNTPKLDITCPAPGQAIVNASGSIFYRWNATGWTPITAPGFAVARSPRIAAASATEVYAVGDSSGTDRSFYRYDGTSWKEIGRKRFVQSPLRVWADPRGGAAYVLSGSGRLEKVTPSSVTVLSYQPSMRDAVMTSATSAFAVGWNMFLARFNGSSWTVDAPPAGTSTSRILEGVWSDGPANAWAVGASSTILRYGGTGWSVVSDAARPIAGTDNYTSVWGTASDVWVAGENSIVHCKTPSSCTVENSGGGTLYSVWGSSASNVIAVGAGGRILRYNGSSWSAMTSPTSRALARVAGSSASDVWAFGDGVLVHFDGTQWTSVPFTGQLQAALSTVPASYNNGAFQLGLWVRGPREAHIAGDGGNIMRWDGSRWWSMNDGRWSAGRRILAITGAAGCAMAVSDGQGDQAAPTLWRAIGTSGCGSTQMGAPTSWP